MIFHMVFYIVNILVSVFHVFQISSYINWYVFYIHVYHNISYIYIYYIYLFLSKRIFHGIFRAAFGGHVGERSPNPSLLRHSLKLKRSENRKIGIFTKNWVAVVEVASSYLTIYVRLVVWQKNRSTAKLFATSPKQRMHWRINAGIRFLRSRQWRTLSLFNDLPFEPNESTWINVQFLDLADPTRFSKKTCCNLHLPRTKSQKIPICSRH